jgi:hypothetical protein
MQGFFNLIYYLNKKISALDCFSELLRILEGIVRDAGSKEFTTFVQHAYRQTKTQKVVLTLMLAAVPPPPNQKNWRFYFFICFYFKFKECL